MYYIHIHKHVRRDTNHDHDEVEDVPAVLRTRALSLTHSISLSLAPCSPSHPPPSSSHPPSPSPCPSLPPPLLSPPFSLFPTPRPLSSSPSLFFSLSLLLSLSSSLPALEPRFLAPGGTPSRATFLYLDSKRICILLASNILFEHVVRIAA